MTKGKGRNPGVGNLDKHIKRTVHKERSQPAARKHLGPLEKHKDHVVRSRRRKEKVKRLLGLKRAASQRNPDEFHINMTKTILDVDSGKVKRKQRSKEEAEKQMQKMLKSNTRNVHYLQYKAHADLNRAKELIQEDALGVITAAPPMNKHIVFAESQEEFIHFDPLKHFDVTHEMLMQHPAVRGKISVVRDTVLPEEVLLSGQKMLSAAQQRRERLKMKEKLKKSGMKGKEIRAEIKRRLNEKRKLKKIRLSSLIDGVAAAAGDNDNGEDENGALDVQGFMERSEQHEKQEALLAARRLKEIQQRVQRSGNLNALAKKIKRQNEGIRRTLQDKRNSRFKPRVVRRAR
uniref:Uncharacterized protein TCIL3000_10_13160 n=1 Tax=Trypanosoma congolense (strain IL3000) TaxID=1068625 RepID=G0UYR6_TRYCI|nr:unnamed protein product [Trypanosoma congolense IL3000]